MCNAVFDPLNTGADSFQIPVFIRSISSQVCLLNRFVAESFPTSTIHQLSMEQKKLRNQYLFILFVCASVQILRLRSILSEEYIIF